MRYINIFRWAGTKSVTLAAVITSLLLLFSCASDNILPEEDLTTELVNQVNALRLSGCQCGPDFMPPVNTLTWNTALENAAQNHANDMYTNNYFSHLSQDGTPPIIRAQRAGYEGEYVGENIARGFTRIRDVVNGWKESEAHCKAMMESLYTEMGAAKKVDYWVLNLGKSK